MRHFYNRRNITPRQNTENNGLFSDSSDDDDNDDDGDDDENGDDQVFRGYRGPPCTTS